GGSAPRSRVLCAPDLPRPRPDSGCA
ncbi:MAG: hypothetical protein AVDCRST_MAG14-1642, partial [uncultured Rubrobacteraceae bacterium]